MENRIDLHWDRMETARRKFLSMIDNWSTEQLEFHESGSWSALQVMEHIIISERGTLHYMKKKTSGGWQNIPLAEDEHGAAGRKLNARLVSTERFKAPSVLPDPVSSLSRDFMMFDWQSVRDELRFFIYSLDESFYHRQIFRQPIAGPVNLFQTMELLANHIQHHTYQLERIKTAMARI
ncbi:MAG: DinB family protein [Crocinitomicaceae bacterium]|nr:DinB family protein [Crocinitomicaceae bacterium]